MALIEMNWAPSRRDLKQFAGIWFPAMCGVIGFIAWKKFGATLNVAICIWSAGLVIGGIGLMVPALIRPLFVGLMLVAFPIGFVVSHVLLAVIYYFVVTPIGLIMRVCGYDPMTRKLDPDATTCCSFGFG